MIDIIALFLEKEKATISSEVRGELPEIDATSTHLPDVLWVYYKSPRSTTAHVKWRWKYLESLKERIVEVARKATIYHQHVTRAYNCTVKPCNFKDGDLIFRIAKHIRRQISKASKFTPHWERSLWSRKPIEVVTTT
ncbi:hypothetical protein DVH24_018625 [Malus domestica]|uniref:Uncharacterized protein n=1 Tax=Malus domestica TaxID=3750 RepID=A0A498HKM0_MALDO|nr:hypothetical protein DVH24_018625 [Malus domestica]